MHIFNLNFDLKASNRLEQSTHQSLNQSVKQEERVKGKKNKYVEGRELELKGA